MSDKIDSTSWTGDTSHRAPEMTPKAKAEIGKLLKWVALGTSTLLLVSVILKEVM